MPFKGPCPKQCWSIVQSRVVDGRNEKQLFPLSRLGLLVVGPENSQIYDSFLPKANRTSCVGGQTWIEIFWLWLEVIKGEEIFGNLRRPVVKKILLYSWEYQSLNSSAHDESIADIRLPWRPILLKFSEFHTKSFLRMRHWMRWISEVMNHIGVTIDFEFKIAQSHKSDRWSDSLVNDCVQFKVKSHKYW